MNSEHWPRRDSNSLASVLPQCRNIVALRGHRSWLWDVDGNKYLDFGSGIAAVSTGHCAPKIVQTIQEQAADV